MISHTKIKFLVDTERVDAGSVHEAFKERYPLIPYCGFYELHKEICLYVQHKQRLSGAQLSYILSTLRPPIKIKEMSKYSKIEGVLLDESGVRTVHGGRRIYSEARVGGAVATDSTGHQGITPTKKKTVTVNPFGQESLGHITLEFIMDLATRPTSWDRVNDFAKELYSEEENMNLRLRAKERYVKVRVDDGEWETKPKIREYDGITKNLLRQYREVLNTFKDSISEDGLERCERVLVSIEFDMSSTDAEYRETYEIFREKTATVIGENISEKVRRKKLNLV